MLNPTLRPIARRAPIGNSDPSLGRKSTSEPSACRGRELRVPLSRVRSLEVGQPFAPFVEKVGTRPERDVIGSHSAVDRGVDRLSEDLDVETEIVNFVGTPHAVPL